MLSLCRFLRKNIFRVGRLGMPAACALGIVRGKIIFILDSEKSADFSEAFFTEENGTENGISGVCGQKKPHFGQNRHISVQQR